MGTPPSPTSASACPSQQNSQPVTSAGLATQLVIAAPEVHQGAAVAVLGVEHFGDQDGVVAGIDHAMDAALEPGERAGDKRHAAVTSVPLDGAETVVPASRKMFGERLLL